MSKRATPGKEKLGHKFGEFAFTHTDEGPLFVCSSEWYNTEVDYLETRIAIDEEFAAVVRRNYLQEEWMEDLRKCL